MAREPQNGDYWIMGYIDAESQPANTDVTGSVCVIDSSNYGDAGDVSGQNNGIYMYSTPKINGGGGGSSQVILAKADSSFSFSVTGGASPNTANIGFWMSEDETSTAALGLVNQLLKSEGANTVTNLDAGLGKLAATYGYWNSLNPVYNAFN